MSFSAIAVEQREKETKILRTFLAFSLVGSLGLHISVLASGLANFLPQAPQIEDKPIEFTLIEKAPVPEKTKPREKPKEPVKPIVEPLKQKVVAPIKTPLVEKPKPVVKPLPVIPVVPKLVVKPQPVLPHKTVLVPRKLFVKPQRIVAAPVEKPIPKPQLDVTQPTNTQSKPNPSPTQQSHENLKRTLRKFTDSPVTHINDGGGGGGLRVATSSGSGTVATVATGSGSGVGGGRGSGTGIATAPRPTGEVSPFDFVDCIKCDLSYPERAKRQGIEGRPGITFDVDHNGNVINIRLTHPSGHTELDEALVSQAKKFKLNSAAAGKQNVELMANFTQPGSQSDREARKRQQKREEAHRQRQAEVEQKKRSAATSANETEATSGNRRRRTMLTSPTNPTSPASPSQQPEKTTQQLEQTPSSSPSSLEPFLPRQQ